MDTIPNLESIRHVRINFDGCCEPVNPGGHAGWGAAVDIIDGGIEQDCVDLVGYCGEGPEMSNNVAEYSGLLGALEHIVSHLEKYSGLPVRILGDSALVVCQQAPRLNSPNLRLAGYRDGCGKKARRGKKGCWEPGSSRGCICPEPPPPWEMRGGLYTQLAWRVQNILCSCAFTWTIEWVSRDFNGRADALSKRVLLDRGINFRIQPE